MSVEFNLAHTLEEHYQAIITQAVTHTIENISFTDEIGAKKQYLKNLNQIIEELFDSIFPKQFYGILENALDQAYRLDVTMEGLFLTEELITFERRKFNNATNLISYQDNEKDVTVYDLYMLMAENIFNLIMDDEELYAYFEFADFDTSIVFGCDFYKAMIKDDYFPDHWVSYGQSLLISELSEKMDLWN